MAVIMISFLDGSGMIPVMIGQHCMQDFLTVLMERYALPEGIAAPEPANRDEDEDEDEPEDEEAIADAVVAALQDFHATVSQAPEPVPEAAEAVLQAGDALEPEPDPTPAEKPPGRSSRATSKPAAGNGSRPSRKKTDARSPASS